MTDEVFSARLDQILLELRELEFQKSALLKEHKEIQEKLGEVRGNARGFKVGDWIEVVDTFTGREPKKTQGVILRFWVDGPRDELVRIYYREDRRTLIATLGIDSNRITKIEGRAQ